MIFTSALSEFGTTCSYRTTIHCNAHRRDRINALSRSSTPSLALYHPVLRGKITRLKATTAKIEHTERHHQPFNPTSIRFYIHAVGSPFHWRWVSCDKTSRWIQLISQCYNKTAQMRYKGLAISSDCILKAGVSLFGKWVCRMVWEKRILSSWLVSITDTNNILQHTLGNNTNTKHIVPPSTHLSKIPGSKCWSELRTLIEAAVKWVFDNLFPPGLVPLISLTDSIPIISSLFKIGEMCAWMMRVIQYIATFRTKGSGCSIVNTKLWRILSKSIAMCCVSSKSSLLPSNLGSTSWTSIVSNCNIP